jgi:hypothetical protein
MEESVYQARWLLFPVFALSFGFMALGIIVS